MSTLTAVPTVCSPGHAWFAAHHQELHDRVRGFATRVPLSERDDCVQDVLAQVLAYVLRAAGRGKLALLTPFTLASYFSAGYREGRRSTGTHCGDVLAPAAAVRHRVRVVSLDAPDQEWSGREGGSLPLSELLPDLRADSPFENCRKNVDYVEILRRQHASRKAKQVFRFLASTHGTGQQVELARQLRVSPPRVTQLKGEVARSLAAEGYKPIGARRQLPVRPPRRTVRRPAPPLNPNTNPVPRRAAGKTRNSRPAPWRRRPGVLNRLSGRPNRGNV